MHKQLPATITLLNAKGATGVSQPINVEGFRHVVLSFATDGGGDANLTCKIQGSIEDTAPDFSSAQSASNMWDYVQAKDLQDASTVNGDTGFAVSGADDHVLYEVNTNHLKWLSVRVTARSQGELTVKASMIEN